MCKCQDASGYGKANLRLILICILVWIAVFYALNVLLPPLLTDLTWKNKDLGLWMERQGPVIMFFVLILFYAWRMNKLDKKYGLYKE